MAAKFGTEEALGFRVFMCISSCAVLSYHILSRLAVALGFHYQAALCHKHAMMCLGASNNSSINSNWKTKNTKNKKNDTAIDNATNIDV